MIKERKTVWSQLLLFNVLLHRFIADYAHNLHLRIVMDSLGTPASLNSVPSDFQ